MFGRGVSLLLEAFLHGFVLVPWMPSPQVTGEGRAHRRLEQPRVRLDDLLPCRAEGRQPGTIPSHRYLDQGVAIRLGTPTEPEVEQRQGTKGRPVEAQHVARSGISVRLLGKRTFDHLPHPDLVGIEESVVAISCHQHCGGDQPRRP
jgi:hypothetical protein